MNRRNPIGQRPAALAVCCALWLTTIAVRAGDAPRSMGQIASPAGSLLRCQKQTCQVLKEGAAVAAGDRVVALPGLRGEVDLHKKEVRLTLLGHLPEKGNNLVLESAVTLHAPGKNALDFTLDRGRVLVRNRAATGAVKVRVHFRKHVLNLDLADSGSAVALELVSQWPAGTPFVKEPKADHMPIANGFLFVLKGPVNVRLDNGSEQNGLRAGVLYHWNNRRGVIGPLKLKELPAWTRTAAATGHTAELLTRFRKQLAKKGVTGALPEMLQGTDPQLRALAVYSLAAAGELPALLKTLNNAKDRGMRREAVTALRHWSGQGAAQDTRLYETLVRDGHKPVQAETVVGLLHGFTQVDQGRRETYETLIDYLTHERPAVRALAAWHLERLAPKAMIAYDALSAPEQRAQAQAAWRKLLRAGKLPPGGASK